MISKATISFIHSLKQKKYRQNYNKFILEGEKIILEGLQESFISFDSIFCLDEKAHLLQDFGVNVSILNAKEMAKVSNLKTPPGILAVANMLPTKSLGQLSLGDVTLFLDDIKDPGNLGTIIRSAEWFGVQNIIVSSETVEWYNPKVIQASMGSFARVNCCVANIAEIKSTLADSTIIATSLDGNSLFDYKAQYPLIMVIGNESRGVSEKVLIAADELLLIPKAETSKAESLNAAIATSLFVSYFTRKS